MISRELLISLGITTLVAGFLFLYMRNRISAVEHKVNMLFKLIENHHIEQNNLHTKNEETANLINVSDDEATDSEESEDTVEDSDYDDTDNEQSTKKISIQETINLGDNPIYNNLMDKISTIKEQTNYSKLTVKELKRVAAEKGLNKYSSLNKEGLIELLENNKE